MKNRIRLFLCVVLLLALSTACLGLSAAADDTYRLSTAETYHEMEVYQFYRDITNANFDQAQGEFAPGLTYDFDNVFLYISGRPSAPGSYTITGRASTEDGNGEEYSLTIVVENPKDPATGEDIQVPVESQQPLLAPVLTKSPTDETVFQGSSAMFIARADNADRIEWYLVEPGSYSAYSLQEAAAYLKGLTYSGQGTEVLELYNIPMEMDAWKVECLFTNAYGNVMSEAATIRVEELKLVNPSIKSQPQGGEKAMDSSVLLSVVADNNTEGSTLKYQWYMSATGNGNLNPISGANSSSYTPPKTEGTIYYTVAVWSSIDGKDSGKTYSTPAAVTYTKTPAAAASPAASAAPSSTPAPLPSLSPSPTIGTETEDESGGIGTLGVLVVVLILSAALAAVILLILRKNSKSAPAASVASVDFMDTLMDESKDKAEPVLEPVQPKAKPVHRDWLCACGALNNTPFCTQCGRAKPVVKPCSNCGWTPESAKQIPRFCPQCGTAFEE